MQKPNILFGEDGKLRSGWRFAIFLVAFIFLGTVFGAAAVLLATLVFGPPHPGSPIFLTLNGVVSTAVALVVGWLCGKYLESLPFDALGATFKNRWFVNLLIGLVGGAITFAVGAGVGLLGGGLSFSFNADAPTNSIVSTLLISFLVFAAAAAFEEALFRGYILQTFVRSGLAWPAIIVTSLAFGAVHLGNPNASWISSLNTALAGIWFGVAYLKTRDLWLPFGLHLAWNWTQGSIFGVEVSGLTDIVKQPLLRETDIGPTWLTGGDYGIEGGIATTVALIVSMLVIRFVPFGKGDDKSSEFKI
ncbi:MAG TPA: type II CAAX endopeptidase family protein [Pyrinomonadaceae bacterium]|nr:type II CAAX endopeptidase family protein [Pyrinomonadaceae bacterium]